MVSVMTADDFRYLGKLLDWCAGQGFCQIEGLQDPDEFAYELGNRLRIPSEDYSADALADAIALQTTASSLAAENDRLNVALAEIDKFWSEHCRLTVWCNANIPDYFSGKSTLAEKNLYDERMRQGDQAKRDFYSACVRLAMSRAALQGE